MSKAYPPYKVIYYDLNERTEYYSTKEEALYDIQQVTLIASKKNAIPKIVIFEFKDGAYRKLQTDHKMLTFDELTTRLNLPSAPKQAFVNKCSVCQESTIKWIDPAKIAILDKQLWLDQKRVLGVERLLRGYAWVCLHCNQLEILV